MHSSFSHTACLAFVIGLVVAKPGIDTRPFTAPSLRSSEPKFKALFVRQQGSCQPNYISCAAQSAPEACCPSGTYCTRDGSGQIACCPPNTLCTGTVGGGSGGGGGVSSSSFATSAGTMTMTAPPTSITSQSNAITSGSTIPNPYYPFPIIATAFADASACLSAYGYCQQQSTSCYQSLGGANGVTVSNMLGGGGITQSGINGAAQGSASAICSALSLTACHGLQTSQCTTIGSGGGVGAGPRQTGCAGARYAAAAGVVGAMGLVF